MEEARKRSWDVGLGIIGPLITVAGILVGVWQFNVGEAKKAEYEHASQIWLKRLETYTSVAKVAGVIAAPPDDNVFKAAIAQFMSAYWSEMILVEDESVEQAMIAFRLEIGDFQNGRSSQERLKVRADTLMKSFRVSLSGGKAIK